MEGALVRRGEGTVDVPRLAEKIVKNVSCPISFEFPDSDHRYLL